MAIYTGKSLREFLRLFSDLADTFGEVPQNERNVRKGKSVGSIGEGESRSVKLAVKSREIRALMAVGYDQTN